MKPVFIAALALCLTGCSALSPAVPTQGPTMTPQLVVQTVIVTVIVTATPSDTPTSTATATATLTPIPTFTGQPTSSTTTSGTAQSSETSPATNTGGTPAAPGSATATLPPDAGGPLFTNLTRSSDHLSLNCQPDTITFGLSATDPKVTEVDLFYRIEDKNSSTISGWIDIGKMVSDGNGNFMFNFKSSMVYSDLRKKEAWLDYQFIGLNNAAQVIGRSARIVQQITYTIDCPG
jgi:hypothetical protein